jgi:hypothetical protein
MFDPAPPPLTPKGAHPMLDVSTLLFAAREALEQIEAQIEIDAGYRSVVNLDNARNNLRIIVTSLEKERIE